MLTHTNSSDAVTFNQHMSSDENICLHITFSFRFLKKMCYFPFEVPIELGYDNYFTNEVAGLGSQLRVRTTDSILHVKMTSVRRQQIIFLHMNDGSMFS